MKRLKHYFILFPVLCACPGFAQFKELSVGDKLPDVELGNIINYKTKKANTADFRGKLLIFDFWATWCGPCVAAFPKLDSLQNKFADKIQIMSVTDQPEKTATTFFEKYKQLGKGHARPSVTDDSVLRKIFKFTYIPHFAWIDGNGKIIAITDVDQVTDENISKVLAQTALSMPLKKDNIKLVDRNNPVFPVTIPVYEKQDDGSYRQYSDSVDPEKILVHSTFTKHIEGLAGIISNRPTRITFNNMTIERMYSLAFFRFRNEYSNRSSWEVADSSLRNFRDYELYQTGRNLAEGNNWKREHTFCYELNVPSSTSRENNYDIMQKDLNNYFGALYNIEGVIEPRKVKVLALVRTSKIDKVASKNKDAAPADFGGLYEVSIVNMPMRTLVDDLRNALQGYFLPMVDETGYTDLINIGIKGELSDLNVLNKALETYDLKFVEKESVLDMVVIRNKKNK